jgi:NADH dehydrogenase/NADH:ubiquinone oxidoreductase subunit G
VFRQFESRRRPLDPGALAALKARADGRCAGSAGAAAEVAEAGRCLQCDCARRTSCDLRRVATKVGADARRFAGNRVAIDGRKVGEGGLSFEPGKCIKCGICVRIAERAGDRPGLAFSGRGAEVRVRVPFDEDIGEAIATAGPECVARCPTGALAWDRHPGEGGRR